MYTDTQPTLRTVATGFAAASIYTVLLFAVSTSPARAATTETRFVQKVERQIAALPAQSPVGHGVATIAVDLDARGKVRDMALVSSTGDKSLDRDAVWAARNLSFPAGKARSVAVVLTYGDAKAPSKIVSQAIVRRYTNAKGEAYANAIPAPNAG